MKKLLDHNPHTGITTDFEYRDGTVTLSQSADAQAGVDYARGLANDPEYSKQGIKGGFWHYAHIPPIVLEQMIQHGINPFEKGAGKAMAQYINEHAPYLKATAKHHG